MCHFPWLYGLISFKKWFCSGSVDERSEMTDESSVTSVHLCAPAGRVVCDFGTTGAGLRNYSVWIPYVPWVMCLKGWKETKMGWENSLQQQQQATLESGC